VTDVLHLAWRYVRYHWIKTAILVVSISLILFVPGGLYVIVQQGAETLTSRAAVTPLLIGSKGSAVDLALSALYFQEPSVEPVAYRERDRVDESGLAVGIPLHVRFVAGRNRIVGTTLEYIAFRGLRLAEGRHMALLGECVVGARAADRLGVAVGGDVLSTPAGAFDVAGSYPLKMKVVGVLAPSGTPDDDVVFTDVKTTWIIEGLAHGHQDMQDPAAESGVLERDGSKVVANASVLSYTEITPENIDSFHFHGDAAEFPIDAVIAVPRDRKSGIMLRGRYETNGADVQIVVPLRVIDVLLDTVFAVRDSVILGSIGVVLAAGAITTLVFALSIRLRRREIVTIRKIGGPRRRLVAILSAEILMVVCVSAVIAAGMTLATARLDTMIIRMISK
jgi:putative ABC transport system permease protein